MKLTFVDADPALVYLCREKGHITSPLDEAGPDTHIIFISTPATITEDGVDVSGIVQACSDVSDLVKKIEPFPRVVITSTVSPGDCENLFIPIIEEKTGKRVAHEFGFYYVPLVSHGEWRNVLVGAATCLPGVSYDPIRDFIRSMDGSALIHYMNLVSAEIAWLSSSFAKATAESVGHQISWLCHLAPGAVASRVLSYAAPMFTGGAYIEHGLSVMNRRFIRELSKKNINPALPMGVEMLREWGLSAVCMQVGSLWKATERNKICVLGQLSDETLGGQLAMALDQAQKLEYTTYDPVRDSEIKLTEKIKDCDFIIITSVFWEFRELEKLDLEGVLILDIPGVLRETKCFKHIIFGDGRWQEDG